jgi:hypothetical protein
MLLLIQNVKDIPSFPVVCMKKAGIYRSVSLSQAEFQNTTARHIL